MPLLPAHTLLQAYSITLAISAYILLTSPITFLSAGSLWLLGESMHIRPAQFTPQDTSTGSGGLTLKQNPSSSTLTQSSRELFAFISFILLLASITQSLLSTPLRYSSTELSKLARQSTNESRPSSQREQDTSAFAEKLYNLHTSQTLFLSLSGIRVLLEGGLVAFIYLVYSDRSGTSQAQTIEDSPVLSLLANRVLFTVAMADMLFWGYLYTVIRDEARDLANILDSRRKMVEENEQ